MVLYIYMVFVHHTMSHIVLSSVLSLFASWFFVLNKILSHFGSLSHIDHHCRCPCQILIHDRLVLALAAAMCQIYSQPDVLCCPQLSRSGHVLYENRRVWGKYDGQFVVSIAYVWDR